MKHTQPKILVYSPTEADYYADYIRQHGYTSVAAASCPEQADEYLSDTEVLLCWRFPTELFSTSKTSSLKWIQSIGAGVNDLVYSVPEQILLTRIVDQFGAPIAEYIFSYLLYLVKDINHMLAAQHEHKWVPFLPGNLMGKTIGVAGLGSIGLEIIRKARAFDMNVLGLSNTGKHANLVDQHFLPTQWTSFVETLDFLVLTLPLTHETHSVVNREVLAALKPDASIINVGRGQLVVESALIDSLKNGQLKAAVLDVFEQEPLPQQNELWLLPNVFVTPHISGPSTPEGVGQFFLENLKKYIAGDPLHGVVNRKLGY